jgi:osmoprotectant transport system substrate-binding protein
MLGMKRRRAMGAGIRRVLRAAAIALALTLGLLPLACGGSDEKPLVIGSNGPDEENVLAEIYIQALRNAGYEVRNLRDLEFNKDGAPGARALRRGAISGYAAHLAPTELVTFGGRDISEIPSDPQKAYLQARATLEKEGLTAFPPTPFARTYVVGALKATADERGLRKVSDLEGQSRELQITGVAGCHSEINCVWGLEKRYGLRFGGFVYTFGVPTEPFHALETGFADLAMLPSTDGRLATEKDKFTVLQEDRHLFPAGNAVFITTPRIVEEAGPKFEETIVAAQKGLTLPVMQKLDAEVEIDEREPAAVAADYLQRAGIGDEDSS